MSSSPASSSTVGSAFSPPGADGFVSSAAACGDGGATAASAGEGVEEEQKSARFREDLAAADGDGAGAKNETAPARALTKARVEGEDGSKRAQEANAILAAASITEALVGGCGWGVGRRSIGWVGGGKDDGPHHTLHKAQLAACMLFPLFYYSKELQILLFWVKLHILFLGKTTYSLGVKLQISLKLHRILTRIT